MTRRVAVRELNATGHDDCLKLTTYFSELRRTGDGFVADGLLDIYARERVKLSLVLRGAAGFGRKRLATDRLLTLSENLPLVSVAVDTRGRIETLLDDVIALTRDGLVTLEPARLVTDEIRPVCVPVQPGTSSRLTIHLDRAARVGGSPAFVAVCDLLHRSGIICATVLTGMDGTADGVRRHGRAGGNSAASIMIVAVGAGELISPLLPELAAMLQRSLLTLEDVQICKRDGDLIAPPSWVSAVGPRNGEVAQKLTIYASQQARHKRSAMHAALSRALRASGASGATQLRGIWGFDGDEAPHGDRPLQIRRDVPMVTVTVDRPAQAWRSFEIVDELTGDAPLVTCETVIAPARSAQ